MHLIESLATLKRMIGWLIALGEHDWSCARAGMSNLSHLGWPSHDERVTMKWLPARIWLGAGQSWPLGWKYTDPS